MTLGTLREEIAKLAHLHPLTPVNVEDIQGFFGRVILEVDSPAFERMEAAVSEAEAGQRCAEGEVDVLSEQVDRLKEENRKLRDAIGKG